MYMTSETERDIDVAARYNPTDVEARWYETWERRSYFAPDPDSGAPTFVITIPPPNVTGELHMGHALTYGIEDVLARFKRMQGFNTLVLPGTDHAGIATQNVVEKQLAREGVSRHELGREKFVERVWQWKERYAEHIRQQFRAMGCGFDWNRERFTMDGAYVDAVQEFFIRLYNEGQIYRGWRVINWCPRCQSAISDIEVEDVERRDPLYYLRYPTPDGESEIVVATVRPETILGDVAIAVHPDDPRYAAYIGKSVLLPLLGRELPVVADAMVDREFGTGAVKITPAHDFNDFEVAERHGLDRPIAIGPDGFITELGGPYAGQTVEQAKSTVLNDLEAGDFLVKVEPHDHRVPTCERCGTLLEPLLSEQWFMHMEELAAPAIEVVKDGRVRFVPERWGRVYLDWMENIRPWTLSRQLWWGHRIPVYYCANGHTVASKSWPDACANCGGPIDHQDPDVLDTWFSSALWPYATLGWPEETSDLRRFYPTSFMNTSSQILYLWIARMIMTGLKFRGDVPFPLVLINPTILNKHGQRMSKSLGTGIDPLDLVRQYGADALRFGLMTSGSTHQQDIRFSSERVEQARNFANKVWNIARFILTTGADDGGLEIALNPADRWILSRTNRVVACVTDDLERYEFSGAGQQIYDFLWSEFADWYLEIAKIRLYDDADPVGQRTVRAVLWTVLHRAMRLLHPYMPFLTEEIWQQLRAAVTPAALKLAGPDNELQESVMVSAWPAAGDLDRDAEAQLEFVREAIRSVRAVRSEYKVDPAAYVSATVSAESLEPILAENASIIARLARLRPFDVHRTIRQKPNRAAALLVGDATFYLPLSELTDTAAELDRVSRELDAVRAARTSLSTKLANQQFVDRAPAAVVDRERIRGEELDEKMRRLQERLELLEA
jgi:valyl-tRNA synthetase